MRTKIQLPGAQRPAFRAGEQASARVVVVAVAALVLGFAGGFYSRQLKPAESANRPTEQSDQAFRLSEGARAVLKHLENPVEIEYYSLIEETNITGGLAFPDQMWRVVQAFEQEGGGKVKAIRHSDISTAGSDAARAAGVQPLDPDGGFTYLGLVVKADRRKEVLPRIPPQWSPALEYDVARMIERVGKTPFVQKVAEDVALAKSASESVQQAIKDPASTSLEEGTRQLREAAQKRFEEVVKTMKAELAAAQERVRKAEQDNDVAGRAAAAAELQKLQLAQREKMTALTLEAQAQVEAWTKLKATK